MTKTKKLIGLGLIIAIVIIIVTISFINKGSSNSFSVSEKKWIESNKKKVIDVAILNNSPYFGVDGKGIFFDFITDLEIKTGLKFNLIPYNIGENPLPSDYSFGITTKKSNDDLSFYKDYYVILGENTIFNITELQGKSVGILKDDINLCEYYLEDIALTTYDDNIALFTAYKNKDIDYIVVPYLQNIKTIITENYNISYQLKDIYNEFILSLNGDEKKLNSIIEKHYNVWLEESFETKYKEQFIDCYFTIKAIDEQTKSMLLSKTYTYGCIANLPYEKVANKDLIGINSKYLKGFANLTGVEFVYKQYNSISSIKSALDKKEIDIVYKDFDITDIKTIETPAIYQNNFVIVSNTENNVIIDSLKSLKGVEVKVIKDSLLNEYFSSESNATLKTYSSISRLFDSLDKNSVLVIDTKTYDYYKKNDLKNYTIIYESTLNIKSSFIVNNNEENKVFRDLFNYYINTLNKKEYTIIGYNNLVKSNVSTSIINLIFKYIIYVSLGAVVFFFILFKIMTNKKTKKQIKKEDKLKFVDMLTSLKNRNYLNYNMSKWDDNDIYPQTIIIVDLNNVQYINDNFGHKEGDNVIVDAANILINSQLENSDIIRTDGNEFLIYLVGYKEDEITSYIKKLNKEFKGLPHSFGAAVGYSIIKDDITSIDDAINEATLDMRTNKESIQD